LCGGLRAVSDVTGSFPKQPLGTAVDLPDNIHATMRLSWLEQLLQSVLSLNDASGTATECTALANIMDHDRNDTFETSPIIVGDH
jgi:hypothetical protein